MLDAVDLSTLCSEHPVPIRKERDTLKKLELIEYLGKIIEMLDAMDLSWDSGLLFLSN